jgi:plastocyanin domain-containing protein
MGLLEWLIPTAGVLVTVVVWSAFALRRGRARADAPAGTQQRRIRVKDGYDPAEIHVAAGRPVRLVFRREETAPCSERVVFPDLGISVDLPAFQDVAVDLPASGPGVHSFYCQMHMLQGWLIVDANTNVRAAGRRQAVAA